MNSSKRAKQLVRKFLAQLMAVIQVSIAKIVYAGSKRYCPVCENHVRKFLPFGDPPRSQARCPICKSLERHRLDWLFFARKTDLFDGKPKNMLHAAPEACLETRFRRIKNLDYLTADLNNPRATVKMDITSIDYPDNTFSVIYCSHVLEHVPDDHKAIAELYRVLKPDGWAVLQVPITSEITYEDPAITEPEERKKYFGQWDHVRRCGPDYIERMRSAGFFAECLYATDVLEELNCIKMGIHKEQPIFFCRKQSPNTQRNSNG